MGWVQFKLNFSNIVTGKIFLIMGLIIFKNQASFLFKLFIVPEGYLTRHWESYYWI